MSTSPPTLTAGPGYIDVEEPMATLAEGIDGLAARVAQEFKTLRAEAAKTHAETLITSATSYVITHNLGTRDVVVQLYEVATPYEQVWATIQRTSLTTVTVIFDVAPTAGALRVVVQGRVD